METAPQTNPVNTSNQSAQNGATNQPNKVKNSSKGKAILITLIIVIIVSLIITLLVIFLIQKNGFYGTDASSSNKLPLATNTGNVKDYGYLYIMSTKLTSITHKGGLTYALTTEIDDPNLSQIDTQALTRVVAMDNDTERELPKKVLEANMDVDLSLFYSLESKQWRINKILIKSSPVEELNKKVTPAPNATPNNQRQATTSAKPTQ